MTEISLQEYYEEVAREGLLFKSGADDVMLLDSSGSEKSPLIDCVNLVISTDDEDRFNDVLTPAGMMLDNYKLNPMFLFEHARGPAGMLTNPDCVLGSTRSITIHDRHIVAEVRYVPLKSNPLPEKIWEMEKKGLMPGNSIGWRPIGNIMRDGNKRIVGQWELIDVSKVIIPVNGKASNKRVSN